MKILTAVVTAVALLGLRQRPPVACDGMKRDQTGGRAGRRAGLADDRQGRPSSLTAGTPPSHL